MRTSPAIKPGVVKYRQVQTPAILTLGDLDARARAQTSPKAQRGASSAAPNHPADGQPRTVRSKGEGCKLADAWAGSIAALGL